MSRIIILNNKVVEIGTGTYKIDFIEGVGRDSKIIDNMRKSTLLIYLHIDIIVIPYEYREDRDRDYELMKDLIQGKIDAEIAQNV